MQTSTIAAGLRITPQRLEVQLREGLAIGLELPGMQRLRCLLAEARAWHDRAFALLRPGASLLD